MHERDSQPTRHHTTASRGKNYKKLMNMKNPEKNIQESAKSSPDGSDSLWDRMSGERQLRKIIPSNVSNYISHKTAASALL